MKLFKYLSIVLIISACKQSNSTSNSMTPSDTTTDQFNSYRLKSSVTLTTKPLAITNINNAVFGFNYTTSSPTNKINYRCALDSSTFVACTSPITYSNLKDGSHTFNVMALNSNNIGQAASSYSFTVDTVAPAAPLLTPSVLGSIINVNSLNISMNSNEGSSVNSLTCSIDGSAFSSCQNPLPLSALIDGNHIIKVKAYDLAGNVSSESSYSVLVDTIAPALSFSAVPAASSTSTTASISFSASDTGAGVQSILCALDSATYTNCTSPITLSGLVVANHVFKVKVIDKASNSKEISTSFAVTAPDTVPPVATTINFIKDKRVIPIPDLAVYPTKGVAKIDPVTGFSVTRIADKADLVGDYSNYVNSQSVIVYSRYSPSNTTGEFYIVHGTNSTSAWVFRSSDNKMMTALKFNPSLGNTSSRSLGELNELRWDYSGANPYRIYFVGRSLPSSQAKYGENPEMSFYYTDINPTTGVQSQPILVRDFANDFKDLPKTSGTWIMNDVEGDSSIDSRYWAWQVNYYSTDLINGAPENTTYTVAIFTYDKLNNKIIGSIRRSCPTAPIAPCTVINTPGTKLPYVTKPNMVEMSPLGTKIIVHFDRAYKGWRDGDIGKLGDSPKAFLPDFSDINSPVIVAADASHSGWAWGANGEELFVSQNNRNDWIEAVDVNKKATNNIAPNYNCSYSGDATNGYSYYCGMKIAYYTQIDPTYTMGFHFSKFYDKNKKGFVLMNTYNPSQPNTADAVNSWSRNQNLLIAIQDASKGGTVINGEKIVRLGSSYNLYYDYRSEGSGALDFSGNNIYVTGNWGFTDGRADAFKIALPTDWYTQLTK